MQKLLLASYPAGACYRRHYDSYDGVDMPRLVTVLLYLDWSPSKGGELRAWLPTPVDGEPRIERVIEPRPGRIVIFFSQEVEHEVSGSGEGEGEGEGEGTGTGTGAGAGTGLGKGED